MLSQSSSRSRHCFLSGPYGVTWGIHPELPAWSQMLELRETRHELGPYTDDVLVPPFRERRAFGTRLCASNLRKTQWMRNTCKEEDGRSANIIPCFKSVAIDCICKVKRYCRRWKSMFCDVSNPLSCWKTYLSKSSKSTRAWSRLEQNERYKSVRWIDDYTL